MLVLDVGFLQQQQLEALGWVGDPTVLAPVVELVREGEGGGGGQEAGEEVGGCMAVQQVLLQGDVLGGALYAPAPDVGSAGTAVPMGGGQRFQLGAAQVVRGITVVAYDAVGGWGG